MNFRGIIKLMRVKQWVKNLFLLIPSFFAGNLSLTELSDPKYLQLLAGVAAFSFVASGIYVINDYKDIENDKIHPKKKFRPLASGEVSVPVALTLAAFLFLGGLTIAFIVNQIFFFLLVAYFLLNIGYSAGLKNISILDIFIVASGFLIRVYCGGAIVDIAISHWLSIMILLLALFLVIAKRRDDLQIKSETGETVRKASRAYNLEFINSCLTMFSAVIIVAYVMYTVSPEVTQRLNSEYVFVTTIFVLAGIMRYLQITFVEQKSGSPTNVLFSDKFILFTILGWIITFYIIIYLI